jgi:hypothetical protein
MGGEFAASRATEFVDRQRKCAFRPPVARLYRRTTAASGGSVRISVP